MTDEERRDFATLRDRLEAAERERNALRKLAGSLDPTNPEAFIRQRNELRTKGSEG